MSIFIEINNGQPIPLMWYSFILLFFRILALENIDDWTQATIESAQRRAVLWKTDYFGF